MAEKLETKIYEHEKEIALIDQKVDNIDQGIKGVYESIKSMDSKIGAMVKVTNDISVVQGKIASMIQKHGDLEKKIDKIEKNLTDKIAPALNVTNRLTFIWEMLTNIKVIISTCAFVSACVYFLNKGL
tara:strand:+ start:7003 stop:7386 length:384 start_codon:yes stop_codon:yes gene_type:complete